VHRRLRALDAEEVAAYVRHRLAVAHVPADVFTTRAVRAVAALSQGVPRLVNGLCDRALGAATRHAVPVVSAALVREALDEPPRTRDARRPPPRRTRRTAARRRPVARRDGRRRMRPSRRRGAALALVVALVLLALGAGWVARHARWFASAAVTPDRRAAETPPTR
jgi:hypothetical protein